MPNQSIYSRFIFKNKVKGAGLYIIEGVYVGRSKHPSFRVATHVEKSIKAAIAQKGFVSCEYLNLAPTDQNETRVIEKLNRLGVNVVNKKSNSNHKRMPKVISEEDRRIARQNLGW